jgi:hypothetical protein
VSHLCSKDRASAALILFAFACAAIVFSSCEKTTTEEVLVPGECSQTYSWKSVWPPLTTNSYFAVYGMGDEDVFAVGDFSAIAHYDGSAWSLTSAGFVGGFRDIWANSTTSVFAVGDGGVYTYDGTSWKPQFNTGNNYYPCVWGSDATDVWCGSTTNAISHWNGTSWTSYALPSYNYFQDMWGISSSDIYAVGQSGGTNLGTVWHFNGTIWTEMTPPGITNAVFYSVWGTAWNNVYVAGDGTTIRRWNGSSWVTMSVSGLPASEQIAAIRGRSANDVYVAFRSSVYHFNGSVWTDTNMMSSLGTYPYLQDLSIGPAKLFAVGENGTVASYDGSSWRNENGGPHHTLQDVWTGGPQEAVAVGSNGVILEYDGTTVADASLPGVTTYLNGIAGSHNNLYVVGSGGKVLHHDGSAWSDISDTGVNTYGLADVWASGSTMFAVGAQERSSASRARRSRR